MFFDSIVHEDRSIRDLLTANYTFVNERLAKHYGIPNVYGSQFRRVDLPSSLDMRRQGSAARTGRAEIAESLRDHRGMSAVTAGDVDVNTEDAYFTGEEAPGGDNPTPDQDIVDDIGKALGLQYDDNEELKGADKVEERDKHRWELDPASSDDYKDRK